MAGGLLQLIGAAIGKDEQGNSNWAYRIADAVNPQDALRRRMYENQDNLAALAPNMDFSQGIMKNLNTLAAADPSILQDYVKGTVGAGTPSAIREYQYFSQLPQDAQEQYLRVKRAEQIKDLGGSIVVLGQGGDITKEIQKTLSPENQPANVAAKEAAQVTGKSMGEALANLGQAEANAQGTLDAIDALANDPGFSAIIGAKNPFKGAIPFTDIVVSGSPAANAQAKLDNLKSKTFLEGFQALKGAGAITETEGTKGEQAIGRLQQTQDEKSFREALVDLRDVVSAGLERIKAKAGMPAGSGSSGVDAKRQKLEELRRLKAQQGAR